MNPHIHKKIGEMIMEFRELKCGYCGSVHRRPLWFLKLYNIFRDRYYLHCSVCHKTSCFRLWLRTVHDVLDPRERESNKGKLWDKRLK